MFTCYNSHLTKSLGAYVNDLSHFLTLEDLQVILGPFGLFSWTMVWYKNCSLQYDGLNKHKEKPNHLKKKKNQEPKLRKKKSYSKI